MSQPRPRTQYSLPVASAFDALAADYDATWSSSFIGTLQRGQVWRVLDGVFRPGDRVLEVGCGTGVDAVHLAEAGVRVHAFDVSPGMLMAAGRRIENERLSDRISCEVGAAEQLSGLVGTGLFDGAFSNFGVFNCVERLDPVAFELARLIRPGGRLVLCVLGRFCVWEVVWYLLHGRLGKALRRLAAATGGIDSSPRPGVTIRVFYPSVSALVAAFQGGFTLTSFRSIGMLVPPSYMERWAVANRGLIRQLEVLDERMSGWPIVRATGDHRLLVFARKDEQKMLVNTSRIRTQVERMAQSELVAIRLRCPACGAGMEELGVSGDAGELCSSCGFQLENTDGIMCALPPHRRNTYARFLEEYLFIRRAEGRGTEEAAYYLALPFQDLTGRNSGQWSIRAITYRFFDREILPQFESDRPLDILDLGAGTGWLSYRLAQRHHLPVAVDILTDSMDGLGAARHYWAQLVQSFPLIAAEFDNLPFADGQFDLAVFNSSLHYSIDYSRTLTETKRCLKPGGRVVVLDSPIYRRPEHGRLMREERHRYFKAKYGFRSDSIPSIEFLDDGTLEDLAGRLHLSWKMYRPWYGWRWHLRPWKAAVKRTRPPSRFGILVGSFGP